MNVRILLFCPLLCLLFGCSYYRTPDTDGVTIPMLFNGKGADPPFLTSLMVDSIIYVQIESEYEIGSVTDVRYCNDLFYLLDDTHKSIVAVDESGHIVFTIQKQGRASGEYISLYAFDVNPSNGEISIYDATGNKMVVYSENGEYIREFAVDGSVELYRDFAVLPDGNYVCYTPDYNQNLRRGVWLVSPDGEFIRQLVTPVHKFIMDSPQLQNYCCKFPDGSVGILGGEDTDNFFHVSTTGDVQVGYHFESDARIPMSIVKKHDLSQLALISGKIYQKFAYFETSNWLIVVAYKGRKVVYIYYDKKNDKVYPVINGNHLIDICSCGDYLMDVLYPDSIIGTELEPNFPDITSDSNPVIKCIKLK